jgi:hypothetical protein
MRRILKKTVILTYLLSMLSAIPTKGSPTILYNNFGPNDSYNDVTAQSIYWFHDGSAHWDSNILGRAAASTFTVPIDSGDYFLDSITLPLYKGSGVTDNLRLLVVEDNAGTPTGLVLDTIVLNPDTLDPPGGQQHIISFISNNRPILNDGQKLWVVLEPNVLNTVDGSNNSGINWFRNDQGATGTIGHRYFHADTQSWQDWYTQDFEVSAFRVEGTQVPVPAALPLLILGVICTAKIRRRLSAEM